MTESATNSDAEASKPANSTRRQRYEAPAEDFAARFDPARPQPEARLIVQALRLTNVVIARLYHRTAIKTRHYLPKHGAGIMVCNHISGLDPLLLQSACPRAMVWMMASEYYHIKPINWFLRQIDAIPVARSGRDLGPTRAALAR